MVAIREQAFGFVGEVIGQVGNLLDHPQSTESGLSRLRKWQVESGSFSSDDRHTFFRMYVLLDPRSFSISLAKSRDISSDAMFANVHSASPTAYIFV